MPPLRDTLELLTNPMYRWKYDIMKKRAVGGWECN